MTTKIQEIHAIPLWLLREYVEELGGTAEGDNYIAGINWAVTLTKLEPRHIGSLKIGQVALQIEGEAEAVTNLQLRLQKKTMRAGA